MLFSVVIPTHNLPRRLERAVGSVAGQDVDESEVIVVDDASNPEHQPRNAKGAEPACASAIATPAFRGKQ